MVAALRYEDAGRDLLRLYKFGARGGALPLARPLGSLLAAAMRATAIGLDVDVVVPVPSHRYRQRQRGFDAAGRLTRHACVAAGLPRPRHLLRRQGRRSARARTPGRVDRLDYGLRQSRAAAIAGRTVLLVDDVVTTGDTIRRCASLLTAAGAAEVRIAVLARTPRLFQIGGGGIS